MATIKVSAMRQDSENATYRLPGSLPFAGTVSVVVADDDPFNVVVIDQQLTD